MGKGCLIAVLSLFLCLSAVAQSPYYAIAVGGSNTGSFTFITSGGASPTLFNQPSVTLNSLNSTGSTFAVAVISDWGAASLGSVSDSKGNTWSLAKSQTTGGSTTRSSVFYSNMTSVGSGHTFTYTAGTNSFPNIYIILFNTTAAASVDQTNGANGTTSTTVQPGSVTPTQANELIIAGLSMNPLTSVTSINSGFNITTSNGSTVNVKVGGAAAYLIQTSINTENPTWTCSGSPTSSANTIVTFKQ